VQDTNTQIEHCNAARERWQRRLTRAVNAIKRIDAKVKRLQRKAAAKPVVEAKPDYNDIPAMLDRRDQIAADKIRADQAEHKRAKALGRIARLKADKSGARKQMPLEGKAALAAIREAP
jgi:hypothetical protein